MDLSKLNSDQLNEMVNDTKGTKKSRASAIAEINRRVSEKQRKLGKGILTKAKDIIVPKAKAIEQSNIARGKKRKIKSEDKVKDRINPLDKPAVKRIKPSSTMTSKQLASQIDTTKAKVKPKVKRKVKPTEDSKFKMVRGKRVKVEPKPKRIKASDVAPPEQLKLREGIGTKPVSTKKPVSTSKKKPKRKDAVSARKTKTLADQPRGSDTEKKTTDKIIRRIAGSKDNVQEIKEETKKVKGDIYSYFKENPFKSVPKSIQPKVTAIKKTPLKDLGRMTANKMESFREGVGKVDDWLEGLFAKAGKKSGTLRTGDERKADREKTEKMERASDFRPMKKDGKVKKKKYMGGGSIKRTSATSMNSKGYAMNRGRTTSIRKPTRTR